MSKATRATIATALNRNLSKAAYRVLLGVVHDVSTWTREWDAIRRASLCELTGFHADTVGRALAELDRAGALTYEPGSGPDQGSWIALAGVSLPAHANRPLMLSLDGGREATTVIVPGATTLVATGATTVIAPNEENFEKKNEQQQELAAVAAAEIKKIREHLGLEATG